MREKELFRASAGWHSGRQDIWPTIKSVLKSHPDCFVCEGRGVAARWLKIKNVAEA